MPKPFELSEETARIVRYLREIDKGNQVTYAELTTHAGFKVVSNSHHLTYARLILQRDHAHVWICVRPRVGVRRLTDAEIADRLPSFFLNGARSKLKRGGDQADVVELKGLDIDQQARFSVDCIQRELAFDSLSRATRRKLEKVARGTSDDLPALTAIEWAFALTPKAKR